MLVKCIKDCKDEYGFIYSIGKTYEFNKGNGFIYSIGKTYEFNKGNENSPWLYRHIPGAGPFGSLAICTLLKENFIDIEEQRDNKLNELGI